MEEITKEATLSKSFNVNLSKSFVNYSIEAEVEFTGDEVAINNAVSAKAYGIIATVENVGESYSYGFEEELEKSGWTVEDTDGNGRTW